jgi:dCTP deaminase
MSALGQFQIRTRLAKDLVVSPLLSIDQVGGSSIDLRMGTVVLMARAGRQSHVDPAAYKEPQSHNDRESKRQKHEKFPIPFKESFLLHPGALALVPTLEWIQIPVDLQGVVTARSSWAREGLNIATATIINPGYEGIITLELANFGEIPIQLYPGLRIAQLALYELNNGTGQKYSAPVVSQFNLAFEPTAGNLLKNDDKFIHLPLAVSLPKPIP